MIPLFGIPSKSKINVPLQGLKRAAGPQYIGLWRANFAPMSDPKPQTEKDAQQDGVPEAERSLEQLLADAQAKLEEQREAWLRALADAENARKRAQADIAQARKFAAERIVEDLLPVMDSLEAALASPESGPAALRAGVELTLRQLQSAFDRAGVAAVSPQAGQRFDPHRHQAMAAVEADQEPNTVLAVMQKGYSLHDRVVRPALVTVAKARAVENPSGNPISDSNLESN
jgi:molecular chaperone GrpE